MVRIFGILTLLASLSFSQNVIDKGLWKIGGGLGVDTYQRDNDKHTIYHISPEVDYFFNQNLGLGMQVRWYRSAHEDWSHQELLILPSFIFVTEKPSWPVYLLAGPSYYTNSDAEEISDYLLGWHAEGGVYLFLNEQVAIIPRFSVMKDSDNSYSKISRLSLSLGYFFKASKK